MAKPGRKSAWIEKIEPRLFEIAGWCRDGYSDQQMSKALNIHVDTFYRYKKLKPEMSEALKVNKAIADLTIENSLFKRAQGYTFNEITIEKQEDAEGNITRTHRKQVKKEVAPDTKAIERWLMNRKPDVWRETKHIELTGKDGGPVKSEKKTIMTTQEIEDELKKRGLPVPEIGGEDL